MKHNFSHAFGALLVFVLFQSQVSAQVGINSDNSAPDNSAMLDVKSTLQGFLAPRMTTMQMGLIASPATGLMIYNTDDKSFYNFNGTAWSKLVSGSFSVLQDADGDTKIQVEKNPDEDIIRFNLAGTEKMVLTGSRLELINPEGNTFLGVNAGKFNTTGTFNVSTGVNALYSNTIGNMNVATGQKAMYNNTSGNDNVANGMNALFSNTTGSSSVANGREALYHNTTGSNNVANGYLALFSNTTGFQNAANGWIALYNNTTGSFNVANGSKALFSSTTGTQNTADGSYALFSNTTGGYNVANGTNAFYSSSTGNNNTGLGFSAGYSNVSGNGNVFIGFQAGYSETGSDKLYIANSLTPTPLIGGNFSTKKVTINNVLQLTPQTSAPPSPINGELYVNSTDNHIYCYLGGVWKQLD